MYLYCHRYFFPFFIFSLFTFHFSFSNKFYRFETIDCILGEKELEHLGAPSSYDLYLFHEGSLFRSYRVFGAHLQEQGGVRGVRFTVWAPRATRVAVAGTFNGWQAHLHPLEKEYNSGVWSVFVPGAKEGDLYKYEIESPDGAVFLKSDPYAFSSEIRPGTASRVCSLEGYRWYDDQWQQEKKNRSVYHEPLLIYEVHLFPNAETAAFILSDLAEELVDYAWSGLYHLEICLSDFDALGTGNRTFLTSRFGAPQFYFLWIAAIRKVWG